MCIYTWMITKVVGMNDPMMITIIAHHIMIHKVNKKPSMNNETTLVYLHNYKSSVIRACPTLLLQMLQNLQ